MTVENNESLAYNLNLFNDAVSNSEYGTNRMTVKVILMKVGVEN
jgi:hypothetical protein